MKFSLIAAVVVLALAQGSFAQEASDLERLSQYFEDMRTRLTQELTQIMSNPDFANHAQNIQTHLEPIATKLQEQFKAVAANVEEQIKPVATDMHAQIQPMVDKFQTQVEAMLKTLTDQAQAIAN